MRGRRGVLYCSCTMTRALRTSSRDDRGVLMLAAIVVLGCSSSQGASTGPSATGHEAGTELDSSAPPVKDSGIDRSAEGGSVVDSNVHGSSDGSAPSAYPGQPGNPVGYSAAASGCAGGLKPWTGGDTVSTSGSAQSPTVYSCYDFVPSSPSGGTLITGSHLKFVGCRFQSNDLEDYNVQVTGADVTFEYSSVTPLVSLAAAPPHAAWPSAAAGQQMIGDGTGYQINGDDGYEYGINIPSGGPVTIDHCDIWGFGNAIVFYDTTAQMIVESTWIHDAADAALQQYHTDGPGYLNGGTPPQNVTIEGNTIASIGNTNAIAFQAASAPYGNILVNANYLSGFGYTADMGLPGSTAGYTHMTFTNNVFGTDIPWVYGPVYADQTVLFNQATNVWKGNTLKVLSGTSPVSGAWAWTASDDGQYLWPDTTTHTSDF
jgi:hypothetical protein